MEYLAALEHIDVLSLTILISIIEISKFAFRHHKGKNGEAPATRQDIRNAVKTITVEQGKQDTKINDNSQRLSFLEGVREGESKINVK